MTMNALDRQRLLEALTLAESSFGLTEPNPRVGCVIGTPQGDVLGRGASQQAGGPHAEVMALRDAQAAGRSVRGATAWVTLEPCAHHGRTPPCCDALIEAGIARVVAALGDPFPQVNGAGMARLRAAGIAATFAEGDIAASAAHVNASFLSRIVRGRPWVRLKIASSLDGRTALPNGKSQWITEEPARKDGHAWRRRAAAVLTGIGTVRCDDPRLDVRLVPTSAQPLRVIVDSQFRLAADARVLAPPGQVIVVGALDTEPTARRLAHTGATLLSLPGADGRVDLGLLLKDLASRGVNEVHVEAGARLNGSLLAAGIVDEVLLYLGPMLLGPGLPMAEWPALQQLEQAERMQVEDVSRLGPDVRLRASTLAGRQLLFDACRTARAAA